MVGAMFVDRRISARISRGEIRQHKSMHSKYRISNWEVKGRREWNFLRSAMLYLLHCCLVDKLCLTLVTPWTEAFQTPLSMGFPKPDTGVSYHFLLQGIFLTQRSNPPLLHFQVDSLPRSLQESLICTLNYAFTILTSFYLLYSS